MLTRIADSLFWMQRYTERVDGIVRVLKIHYHASLDAERKHNHSWNLVLKFCTNLNDEQILAFNNQPNAIFKYIFLDKTNENSVRNIITQIRNNARSVQDQTTIEVWRCINDYYHFSQSNLVEDMIDKSEIFQLAEKFIQFNFLYSGVINVTMPRYEAFHFMQLGTHVERSLQTIDFLDYKFNDFDYDLNSQTEILYWKYLLLSVSGYEFYLKKFNQGLNGSDVLNMILFVKNFPRSIKYCLQSLIFYIDHIHTDNSNPAYKQLKYDLGKLMSVLLYTQVNNYSQSELNEFLKKIKSNLNAISLKLQQYYFHFQ
ncbi:MAG: alpha-E domain-containing protein [Alphaproteobacteria bacterium]|nr:alpha-E domain-containing protein [Alphaproteobacteria bacterium]